MRGVGSACISSQLGGVLFTFTPGDLSAPEHLYIISNLNPVMFAHPNTVRIVNSRFVSIYKTSSKRHDGGCIEFASYGDVNSGNIATCSLGIEDVGRDIDHLVSPSDVRCSSTPHTFTQATRSTVLSHLNSTRNSYMRPSSLVGMNSDTTVT